MDNNNETLKKPIKEQGENTSDITAGQNERTVENLSEYKSINEANRNQLLENKDNKFRFYEKDSGASITRESQIENGKRVYLFNLMDKDGKFVQDTETRTLQVTEKFDADEIDNETSKFLSSGAVNPENIMSSKDAKIALLSGVITRKEYLNVEKRLEQGTAKNAEKENEKVEEIEEQGSEDLGEKQEEENKDKNESKEEEEKFIEFKNMQEKIKNELENLASSLENISKNSTNPEIQTLEKNKVLESVDKVMLYLKEMPVNTKEIETLFTNEEQKNYLIKNQENNNDLLSKLSTSSESLEVTKNDAVFNKNIKLIKESME